jgi:AraC-like DNA-binding protein
VTNDYEARIERVVAYIYEHLDDPLDLNRLAEVACLSPYHWHRVYKAMRGETIATTIKRHRLTRAAVRLAQTSMPIEQVARDSGYDNVQSFTRIFKSTYGMPPATYRARGSHRLEHRGAYISISVARSTGCSPGSSPPVRSALMCDPSRSSTTTRRRYPRRNCVRAPAWSRTRCRPSSHPSSARRSPAAEYAVLRHKGPYARHEKAGL